MARGEFKIVKYALGDEEINYELFNSSHPSGSAFSDLQIMQTPVLEAFTNNTSLMKTKLITINRNNILYMPLLRLNVNASKHPTINSSDGLDTAKDGSTFTNGFVMTADENTKSKVETTPTQTFDRKGWFWGAGTLGEATRKFICIDQGIETAGNPPITTPMPDDLKESAFLVRMDHRLLRLSIRRGPSDYDNMQNSFVDDDAIATYYIPYSNLNGAPDDGGRQSYRVDSTAQSNYQKWVSSEAFNGPLGPRLMIYPRASMHIQQSDALFNELGSSATGTQGTVGFAGNYKYIDTLINIVGVTSGYSIDVPLRIVRAS